MKTSVSPRPIMTARILTTSAASLLVGLVLSDKTACAQAISIGAPTTYAQNFDGLGTGTVVWADNGTFSGWYAEIGSTPAADGSATVSDGSNGGLSGLINTATT